MDSFLSFIQNPADIIGIISVIVLFLTRLYTTICVQYPREITVGTGAP
jgi:hypothetical protein